MRSGSLRANQTNWGTATTTERESRPRETLDSRNSLIADWSVRLTSPKCWHAASKKMPTEGHVSGEVETKGTGLSSEGRSLTTSAGASLDRSHFSTSLFARFRRSAAPLRSTFLDRRLPQNAERLNLHQIPGSPRHSTPVSAAAAVACHLEVCFSCGS